MPAMLSDWNTNTEARVCLRLCLAELAPKHMVTVV